MDDRFITWCRDQRAYMVRLREKYASGQSTIGEIRNGVMIDQTKEQITDLDSRIGSLDQILNDLDQA